MGFFKDFKEDLSLAVNELLPNEELIEDNKEIEDQLVNTLDTEEVISDEVLDAERLKEWLEGFAQEDQEESEDNMKDDIEDDVDDDIEDDIEDNIEDNIEDISEEDFDFYSNIEIDEKVEVDDMDDNVDLELLEAMNAAEVDVVEVNEKVDIKVRATSVVSDDEVTVISKGTTITGSISSDGSLDIMGNVTGDIECLGKLSITGKIVGNSSAAEVYINTERLEGSIASEGTVKVGLGTVIIGDIVATSGVIAGAVKGEIDVNGPIVIDSTAIIKGNIKAKSVQINNGAVIEGFCSLSYSAVDVDNIFE